MIQISVFRYTFGNAEQILYLNDEDSCINGKQHIHITNQSSLILRCALLIVFDIENI